MTDFTDELTINEAACALDRALDFGGEPAIIGYTDASEPLVITGSDDPMTVVNVVTARG